ncbi:MAG: NTP transferase domain-containing protein [Prolixibacteraceae bacterium]|jgi:NDP-sugar pyrophosphorylase family protein|nr:NTP transferase domain-containing protein [Prolixibacteraceae bacterium]MDI9561957.1 sugar phosphate nucleotidyltransferase [Pseudomonadota bacterium]
MMAVILAGGKGVRLKPFTMVIPKPLLPIGDVPIIEVVIRQIAASGIRRVAVMLGYMAQLFIATFGDGSRWGVNIEYYIEDEPLGTAGSLRMLKNPERHMLVMNGDILTTLDYRKIVDYHKAHNASGTIAVTQRKAHIDYGVIVKSDGGVLGEYREKPVLEYDVSMGINVLSSESLDLIPSDGKFDIPELMTALIRAGKKVMCFDTDCYWQDIGRFEDYEQASADFVSNPGFFLP